MKIRESLGSLGPYDFDGDLEDVLAKLEKYKAYANVKIDTDCDSRDNTYTFFITHERDETNKEIEDRLVREKQREKEELKNKKIELKKKEKSEYTKYLLLKAKYENNL